MDYTVNWRNFSVGFLPHLKKIDEIVLNSLPRHHKLRCRWNARSFKGNCLPLDGLLWLKKWPSLIGQIGKLIQPNTFYLCITGRCALIVSGLNLRRFLRSVRMGCD